MHFDHQAHLQRAIKLKRNKELLHPQCCRAQNIPKQSRARGQTYIELSSLKITLGIRFVFPSCNAPTHTIKQVLPDCKTFQQMR